MIAWLKNYDIPRVKVISKDDIESLSVPYVLYSGSEEKTEVAMKIIAFGIDYTPFYQIRDSENKITIMTKNKE